MVSFPNSNGDQEYRVVINMKERNVARKRKVSNKVYVASAKDLTVKLHEGQDST